MKLKKQYNKYLTLIITLFISLSFVSCEFFTFSELHEIESPATQNDASVELLEESVNRPVKHKFVFNAAIEGQNSSSRTAYPEFTAANYDYSIACSDSSFTETNGTYSSSQISFEVTCQTFTTPKEVTIFAKDKTTGKKLLFGKTFVTCGSSTPFTVYFKPYTSADGNTETLPNGDVDLTIGVSSSLPSISYIISCEIYSGNTKVSSTSTGSSFQIENDGTSTVHIKKGTDSKIPVGQYQARIGIYKSDDNTVLRDYRIQTIEIWPELETNKWFLGTTSSENVNSWSIVIDENEVRYYVKGSSNWTGIYSSGVLPSGITVASPSNSNSGSILSPLETIQGAISKCQDANTVYTIICDGDFTSGFNFGSIMTSATNNCNVRIVGGGNSGNISTVSGSCQICTNKNIVLENLKIQKTSGTEAALVLVTKAVCSLTLYNCEISSNAYAISTGVIETDSKLIFKGSTYIAPASGDVNKVVLNANCKISIDGVLDTSNDVGTNLRTIASLLIQNGILGNQYVFVETGSGAVLATESKRFHYTEYPISINTEGKLALSSSQFYVASGDSTPAGSATGDGSSTAPYASVTSAVQRIKALNTASDYTINITGTIAEGSVITLSQGSLNTDTLGAFTGSTLTLHGTDANAKLNGNSSYQILNISGALDLTITNLTFINGTASYGGGIYIGSNATVKLGNGVVLTKNNATTGGGAIYNEGTLCIYDNALIGYAANTLKTSNTAALDAGGNGKTAIYNNEGTIWMGYTAPNESDNSGNVCQIAGNYGAFKIDGGYLYIRAGNIHHNYANPVGAGVYLYGYSSLQMSGGTINNNSTDGAGGGVYISSTATFNMSGGIIEENTAPADGGGAVYNDKGSLLMSGDASIPAPLYAAGKNDVYLVPDTSGMGGAWSGVITTSTSVAPSDGIYATVTPSEYTPDTILVKQQYPDNPSYSTDDYYKFVRVTPQVLQSTPPLKQGWTVNSEGKLEKSIYLGSITVSALNYTNASGITDSQVFIPNRKIGTIKSIVASDHEVTQGEYEKYCKYGGTEPSVSYGKGTFYPVYFVSWYDAVIYCNLRSKAEHLDCVYMVDGSTEVTDWGAAGNATTGYCAPSGCNWEVKTIGNANGWRLPYEVEWEYLARGGDLNDSGQYTYSGSNTPENVAWYLANRDGNKTHPVNTDKVTGINSANALGLYDMSGNVFELVNDRYNEPANITFKTPFDGPDHDESTSMQTVIRGGQRTSDLAGINCSNRWYAERAGRYADIGFRVVRGAQFIGPKIPSQKEVGDIVFTDGSAMAYSDYNALNSTAKNEKKAYAIALIFYKGADLNSDGSSTVRTLGVGLKHDSSNKKWCVNEINTNISAIQCNDSGEGESLTFTGDLNGSDNFNAVKSFAGLTESEIETNYPIFGFARNYKDIATNITGTPYEDGWYIPSIAELFKIYKNGISDDKIFDLNGAISSLGGNKLYNGLYWASSQSTDKKYYDLQFPGPNYNLFLGKMGSATLSMCRACCIHEF